MPRVSYATLMELTVSGTTNGSVYGFPDTFVTQTVLFDSDAVPVADDNWAVSQYPIVSYELDFGGTAFTPITQPQIEIVDGSVDQSE